MPRAFPIPTPSTHIPEEYLHRLYAHSAPGAWLKTNEHGALLCQQPACRTVQPCLNLYRCKDCVGGQLYCKPCLLELHRHHPYHRIEGWTAGAGAFFRPTSLFDTGLVVHLGHGGEECHTPQVRGDGLSSLTVVHTNGHHKVHVMYCQCHGDLRPDRHVQLFDNGLFPATTEQPATAFTFPLLRQFQLFNMASKTSAWDYHQGLMRFTDAVDPTAANVSCVICMLLREHAN